MSLLLRSPQAWENLFEALRDSGEIDETYELKALQLSMSQGSTNCDQAHIFLCFDKGNSQYAAPLYDFEYFQSDVANYLRLSESIFSSLQWWERWLPFYGILDVNVISVSAILPVSLVDANCHKVPIPYL